MSKIAELVSQLARPVVESVGCTLWDVEYVKEAGQWYLRVYIDSPGGVGIEQCEAVSRALDPILDEEDPIDGSYTFEVSSAGAERVLKRPSDFEQFMGSAVLIRLFAPRDGKKEFSGRLCAYEDGNVTINFNEEELTFLKPEVALVRLQIEI